MQWSIMVSRGEGTTHSQKGRAIFRWSLTARRWVDLPLIFERDTLKESDQQARDVCYRHNIPSPYDEPSELVDTVPKK